MNFKIQLECGQIPNVMAALPNIGSGVCESFVIPVLVPRCKVRLTPAAGVPCSNAANKGECKIGCEVNFAPDKSPPGGQSSRMYRPMHKLRKKMAICCAPSHNFVGLYLRNIVQSLVGLW